MAVRGFVSRCLTWLLVFLLTFVFTVSWGHAQDNKPIPPQSWQLKGIMAALDDSDPEIWVLALDKLSEYKVDELKPPLEISDDKYQEIVELLDYKKNSDVQRAAASTLGKLGAKDQADKLAALLSTSNNSSVQSAAASALGKMGAKDQADKLAALLSTSNNSSVQSAAASALGSIGAKDQADKLAALLSTSNNSSVQRAVAKALGSIGAKDQADKLVALLSTSKDSSVQIAAAKALGAMGAKEQADKLGALLSTSNNSWVQSSAAYALGQLRAKEQADKLGALLSTSNAFWVQTAAAKALGSIGAKEQADQLVHLLSTSNNSLVQKAAAEALGKMGAKEQADQLVYLLDSNNIDIEVQVEVAGVLRKIGTKEQADKLFDLLTSNNIVTQKMAAYALGGIGDKEHATQVATLLSTSNESNVQQVAIEVLGKMRAKQYAVQIATLLSTSNESDIQQVAIEALGKMGEKEQSDKIATLLSNSDNSNVQEEALEVLEKFGVADWKRILSILNAASISHSNYATDQRFLAYFLSDAKEETLILIKWLGLPIEYPDLENYNHEEAVKTLQVFKKAWQPSESLPRLRNDLERQIARVVSKGKWKFQDIGLLQAHYLNLQAVNSTHADAVKATINNLRGWKWIFRAWKIWLAHFCFWVLLIFAYPKSPQIQAIFFWNPWVRRIIGLGYVEFLLTWIPFIRSRLFAPFKESLLADAKLDYTDLAAYFPQSLVEIEASQRIKPLQTVIPKLKGQIILQGESGLGKSLFLRHLVKQSQRITVYLTADRCRVGVIEAIQNKLKGKAQDHDFLRNLIYSGAMDICIDGLNEVDADTRASIKRFVEDYFKGNIIITTQPLEWKPPATARIYILQPLTKNQIKEFLLSRQPYLAAESQLDQQEYDRSCLEYLDKALNNNLSGEELADVPNILSNPMDLTVLSQIIASGESPDLFRLHQQQYDLMAKDYYKIHRNEFPLEKFAEHAYKIRLDNNPALSESEFYRELQCMERHKMVISQQFLNAAKEPVNEWKFRHDKIWEFFAVRTFLGKNNNRRSDHKGDPRFRNIYFLLVNLLPLEDAETLERELILYAADTGDHTVSDRFVQLLGIRKAQS